jgi:WD40 repeat protein
MCIGRKEYAESSQKRVVVGMPGEREIKVWCYADHRARVQDTLTGHSGTGTLVKVSPDEQKFVSVADEQVVVWSLQPGAKLHTFSGHTGKVCCAAWSSDSKLVASGGADKVVLVWDAETGNQVMDPLRGHSDSVLHVVFDTKTSFMVSASLDKTIVVWKLDDGSKTATERHRFTTHAYYVDKISLSPDDKFVVSGSSYDNMVEMWDVNSGQQIRVLMGVRVTSLEDVVWSQDGKRIESVATEGGNVNVNTMHLKVSDDAMHIYIHSIFEDERLWYPTNTYMHMSVCAHCVQT